MSTSPTAQPLHFRERDGVAIYYDITGIQGSADYPFRSRIPTLREAVAIAKEYRGICMEGVATRIYRSRAKLAPAGGDYHHQVRQTHCWRVTTGGKIQLLDGPYRPWHSRRGQANKGVNAYVENLPLMLDRGHNLQCQLADLAAIAEKIGLYHAAGFLLGHVEVHFPLPFTGVAPQLESRPPSKPLVQLRAWPGRNFDKLVAIIAAAGVVASVHAWRWPVNSTAWLLLAKDVLLVCGLLALVMGIGDWVLRRKVERIARSIEGESRSA